MVVTTGSVVLVTGYRLETSAANRHDLTLMSLLKIYLVIKALSLTRGLKERLYRVRIGFVRNPNEPKMNQFRKYQPEPERTKKKILTNSERNRTPTNYGELYFDIFGKIVKKCNKKFFFFNHTLPKISKKIHWISKIWPGDSYRPSKGRVFSSRFHPYLFSYNIVHHYLWDMSNKIMR